MQKNVNKTDEKDKCKVSQSLQNNLETNFSRSVENFKNHIENKIHVIHEDKLVSNHINSEVSYLHIH